MVYSVSYDLRKPGRNYDELYKVIKSAPSYCHPLESLWFIRTNETVQTWSDRLRKQIDENDLLFVVDITGQAYSGWLPQSAWEWLKQNSQQKAGIERLQKGQGTHHVSSCGFDRAGSGKS